MDRYGNKENKQAYGDWTAFRWSPLRAPQSARRIQEGSEGRPLIVYGPPPNSKGDG